MKSTSEQGELVKLIDGALKMIPTNQEVVIAHRYPIEGNFLQDRLQSVRVELEKLREKLLGGTR